MANRHVSKEQDRPDTKRLVLACMLVKYVFALVFPLLCVLFQRKSVGYLAVAAVELILAICVTELLARVKTWLAYGVNTLFLFVVNAQFAVLYWGNTFVSPAMLDNLDSIQALSGKAALYILTAVLVFAFSILPICAVRWGKLPVLLGLPAVLYLMVIGLGVIRYSPFYAIPQTYTQMKRWSQMIADLDGVVDGADFFRTGVTDYREKPKELPESPNVILIFVEGLSQNIIDDPRNIMPNLQNLQRQGIAFENYYNHTFATYMGLSGQLYSGYQYNNDDKNNLISLQDIFSYYGYQTAFINTEPANEDFSNFLTELEFDAVLTDETVGVYLPDKTAYQMLFDTAQKMAEEEKPFLLAMYSFETHVGFNSSDMHYGDGSDPLLNKFYNADMHIGRFLEQLEASDLAEDTLVVITADHATYADADFAAAFPDYERLITSLDRIPMILYYRGIESERVDANGRNSINLAPTLLDFLDMTAGNYFWGKSLFAIEEGDWMDTTFETLADTYSTKGNVIHALDSEESRVFEERLSQYFALKLLDEAMLDEWTNSAHVYATENEARTAIEISIENASEFAKFSIAVWSAQDGQDDLKWFAVQREGEGTVKYAADLSDYFTNGPYHIHVYGCREGEDEMNYMCNTSVTVTLPSQQITGDLEEGSE